MNRSIDWAKIEPSPALAELMREDREREPDAPVGGWRGEWAVQGDEPPPVQPQPFVIPPAEWDAERDRARAAEAQQALEPTRSSYPAPRGAQNRPRWP